MPNLPGCPDSVPEATALPAFPAPTCALYFQYLREEAVQSVNFGLSRPLYLHSVYTRSHPLWDGGPTQIYGIVLAQEATDNSAKTLFVDAEGAIVGVYRGCGPPPPPFPDPARFQISSYILPPLPR